MSGADLKIKQLGAMVKVKRFTDDRRPIMQPIGFQEDGKPQVEQATKLIVLHRGDDLPQDLADGELDRLKSLNAVGTAEEVAAVGQPIQEAEAHAVAVAEAEAAAAAPQRVKDAAGFPDLRALTDPELIAWYEGAEPTVKALVEYVAGDATLAARVVEAEKAATGGDPRPTLIDAMEKVAEGGD